MSGMRVTSIILAAVFVIAIPLIGVGLVVVGAPMWEWYQGTGSASHADTSSSSVPANR